MHVTRRVENNIESPSHLSQRYPHAMSQQGILLWANSIRSAMVHDPCRQALKDQIQSHGFLFLDDYLDGILARAKRE